MDEFAKSPGEYLKIDTNQMREVDRLMIEEYHIDLVQMMENAGRCLAILTRERFFDHDVEGRQIAVLVGTGGNGGGAMVAARRLHGWGAKVHVYTTNVEEKFTPIPRHQFRILKRMGVPISLVNDSFNPILVDAVLDGIIGYSLSGNPKEIAAKMIRWANIQLAPVISLDTPSGLDLTTGKMFDPIINATATLTLAMPKQGLFAKAARKVVGELYLGDISVPPELYEEPTLELKSNNIFRYSDVVRIN